LLKHNVTQLYDFMIILLVGKADDVDLTSTQSSLIILSIQKGY
jgi:hypothetical protein